MFRNSYDNDSVTYSPTGRLFQVEYALEAIKQGSAAVGLVSRTHCVLVALKRNAEELGSYQKKLFRVDNHMGVALAGLAPDARSLGTHLRSLSIRQQLLFDAPLPVSKAVASIADKAQANTQQYGRRPYGVGLLVAGYDETGAHLFEFLPSGSMLEYVASAIGARSQAARTYLERNIDEFADSTLEQLVVHGLNALRDTLPQDKELNTQNTSVAIVGKDKEFTLVEDDDVGPWLDKLSSLGRSSGGLTEQGTAQEGATEGAAETTAEGAETTQEGSAGSADNADDRMDES